MKTLSEAAFETFLRENDLSFQKVEEQKSQRPDYLVWIGEVKLLFEVKELSKDENFGVIRDGSSIHSHSRTLGEHIRKKINKSQKQIQFGANQGIPSILLIYNNIDPVHLFGTEDEDFIAAMYGAYTLLLDVTNKKTVDTFRGANGSMKGKNTSFSAIGRLLPTRKGYGLTLFENVFAKVKIPYESLPPCFEVNRVEIRPSENV